MRVGVSDLPLHYGYCPEWLFEKMRKLAREISQIIIFEYGRKEFLKRISNPFFFQSLGCILGFDWHSSGLTTTVTAALKEANLKEFGIAVFGGKGKASRKVPNEIEKIADEFNFGEKKVEELKYSSKMAAKIDNSVLQDGFQLYHHSFFVSEDGKWAVIQQGMDLKKGFARRYHWLSFELKKFVLEPHKAICCDLKKEKILNLVAKESRETQKCITDLVNENPKKLIKYVAPKNSLVRYLKMPTKHFIDLKDYQKLYKVHEFKPKNFEEFVSLKGVGPKTIRALALISHLIFGTELSWKDPAKYSFAHGGKDGTPYRVSKKLLDSSIKILRDAIENAKLKRDEKIKLLKKLKENFEI